eukprot:TRINITY_DN5810_c0_g2_i1.p1 TRINITY_DN5810_c0_g2~~TRINITY_DN5810_c0_g2_i1.p1  ORF type:complete len:358 (+),score=30.23 TRINITY_DN5810_c0_g2_i1:43-1116(+)
MATQVVLCAVGVVSMVMGLARYTLAPVRSFPPVVGKYKNLGYRKFRIQGGPKVHCIYPTSEQSNVYDANREYTPIESALGLGAAFNSWLLTCIVPAFLWGQLHPDWMREGATPIPNTPIIIFSHGLYGTSDMYTHLCRELASNGLMVIAINHEDGTSTSCGKTLPYKRPPKTLVYSNRSEVQDFRAPFFSKRKDEIQTVLDYLHSSDAQHQDLFSQADTSKIAFAGHSFGAATAVVAADHFDQFNCVLLYDIWSYPIPNSSFKVTKPSISFLSSQFANGGESSLTKTLLNASGTSSFYLPGTNHQLWSDFAWFSPFGRSWKIETHREMIAASHAFIDSHFYKRSIETPSSGEAMLPF